MKTIRFTCADTHETHTAPIAAVSCSTTNRNSDLYAADYRAAIYGQSVGRITKSTYRNIMDALPDSNPAPDPETTDILKTIETISSMYETQQWNHEKCAVRMMVAIGQALVKRLREEG